jgi:crotonobetainyl-CoA:carnitine CoA-transferase CaiB-like acyl-CoA transferase
LALSGLRVLELGHWIAAPYCTSLLADFGADVVKVERPGRGDEQRHSPPFIDGRGAAFLALNRNKRSIGLDLTHPEDRATCMALCRQADVVVENFRPGTLDRIGFGYDAVAEANPGLVYCSISGFGSTGPLADQGGFDLIGQAMSGLMAACGPADGPPHRLPMAVGDFATGIYAAFGILAALHTRHRNGGRGQKVEASLLDACLSLNTLDAAQCLATGEAPTRTGQGARNAAPYQVFRTQDGWVVVAAAGQHLWERLCALLGASSLTEDARFATNASRLAHAEVLAEAVQIHLMRRPSSHWLAVLPEVGIPAAPVLDVNRALHHPQVEARDVVLEPEGGAGRVLAPPLRLSGSRRQRWSRAPDVGEQDEDILDEWLRPVAGNRTNRMTPRENEAS